MAFDLSSVSGGNGNRPPRIILLGVEKIGKSTFAASADRPVFIPLKGEEGIDGINVPQFPTCHSVDDVFQCLTSIYSEQHEFGTVVIDSASAFEPIAWAEVCRKNVDKNGNPHPVESIEKVGGGYSKGYMEALYVWRRLTEAFDALRSTRNMASIVIGHVKVKRFDDPTGDSYDQYQFDVHEKAASLLYRWADVILFANNKVVVKKEDIGFGNEKHRGIDITNGARFLYTQKRPSHPGGGRGVYGNLPYEIPLSWDNFMDAVAAQLQK